MTGDLAILLFRMVVTAGIVLTASWVVSRTGPFLGSLVATLPLSIGPAYLFLARDHDPAFLAESALTGLVGLGAASAFVTVYAKVAPRVGTLPSLALALTVWAAFLLLLGRRTWHLADGAAASAVLMLAGVALTQAARRQEVSVAAATRPLDVAIRAASVMLLVAGVMVLGRVVGPEAAGYAAMVPVVFTSLAMVLQPRVGGVAVAAVLSHGLVAMLSYLPALALIHAGAVPLGSGLSLALALAICLAWSGTLMAFRRMTASRA